MNKYSRKCIACLVLAALMVLATACIGHAAQIVPVSYTGVGGEGSWTDPAGIRLTDGVLGSDAYTDGKWVGWQYMDPVFVFDFGATMAFTECAVQSLSASSAGIYLVKGIDLSFSNDGVEYGSPVHFESTHTQYTMSGSQSVVSPPFSATGRYVKMTFTRWNTGLWVFLSEVSFQGGQPGGVLKGQVTLQNYTPAFSTPVAVGIEFSQGGTLVTQKDVILEQLTTSNGNTVGNYSVTPGPGTYDVAFKASQFLRTVLQDVPINYYSETIRDVSLANGDANGNNNVTNTDLNTVLMSIDASGDWHAAQSGCVIALDHTAQSAIVVQSLQRHAAMAGELQQILREMTGATLPIKTTADTDIGIVLGTAEAFPSLAEEESVGELGPDGFLIRSEKKRVWILANTDQGLQNGVYALLEELGCRWYFADPAWTVIPGKPTLVVETNKKEKPSYDCRIMWYEAGAPTAQLQQGYHSWMIHNRMYGSFKISVGHAYDEYIPKSLFNTHPEWFALVNGQRQNTQLCLSNAEVQQQLVDAVLNKFQNNPELNMASMEPNDGGKEVYCHCGPCTAMGTQSDQVFTVANIVARAVGQQYPGKWIGLLAYADHSDPPYFNIEPNVYVQVATLYNWTSLTFDQQVSSFKAKGAKLGVYDYISGTAWYNDKPGRSPASLTYKYASDLRRYRNLGAASYNTQMSLNWGATGLGCWVGAKLLWNSDLDAHALTQDFYSNAFKHAAVPMGRLYDRWAAMNGQEITRTGLALAMVDLHNAYASENDPKVRARLDHVAMYLHWLRLFLDYDASVGMANSIVIQRAHSHITYTQRIQDTGLVHTLGLLSPAYYPLNNIYARAAAILGSNWLSSVDTWRTEGRTAGIPSSDEAYQTFLEDYATR